MTSACVRQAEDRDVTSQLTYSLPEGGVFRIDPGTGEITVNKTEGIDLMDVQGREMVPLLVEVSDPMGGLWGRGGWRSDCGWGVVRTL